MYSADAAKGNPSGIPGCSSIGKNRRKVEYGREAKHIQEFNELGEDRRGSCIADEVVAIIAGLAATEVEGVASMAGNITNELVGKLGMKNSVQRREGDDVWKAWLPWIWL